MATSKGILGRYFDYSAQIDTALTFVFGAYSMYILNLVFANPGTHPQAMVDAWTWFHFMFGIVTAYMLYKFTKSKKMVVTLSMSVQVGWKMYEFATGYALFVQSLPNVTFDLIVGLLGAVLVVEILVYAIFRKPY